MVLRNELYGDWCVVLGEFELGKFNEYEFEVYDNMFVLIIEVLLDFVVDIELYLKKGDVFNLLKNVYDYNVMFLVGELFLGVWVWVDNLLNFIGLFYFYEYMLVNEDLNWIVVGMYFVVVCFKEFKNYLFIEE